MKTAEKKDRCPRALIFSTTDMNNMQRLHDTPFKSPPINIFDIARDIIYLMICTSATGAAALPAAYPSHEANWRASVLKGFPITKL